MNTTYDYENVTINPDLLLAMLTQTHGSEYIVESGLIKTNNKKKAHSGDRKRTTTSDGRPVPRPAEALTDEQVRDIAEYFLSSDQTFKYRNYLIFMLGINTGRRMGDIVSLKIKDILNYEDGSINPYVTIREGKTEKLYDIVLNQYCIDAIRMHLDALPNSVVSNGENYLLYSRKKQQSKFYKSRIDDETGEMIPNPFFGCNVVRVDTVYSIFNSAAKALGIKGQTHFSTHSCRKTYGEKLLNSNPNPSEALALLQDDWGHERSSTTLKYLGKLKANRKKMVANFEW